MSRLNVKKGLIFVALIAPVYAPTAWAAIGLSNSPPPVEVVLAGPGENTGYELNPSQGAAVKPDSAVIYKYRNDQVVEPLFSAKASRKSATSLASVSGIQVDPGNDSLSRTAAAAWWRSNSPANRRVVPQLAKKKVSALSGKKSKGIALGKTGAGNKNKAPGKGAKSKAPGKGNNKGRINGPIVLNKGKHKGAENGNGNAIGQANSPGNEVLSAPEPSSLLIWLGAVLAGSGVAFARRRRVF